MLDSKCNPFKRVSVVDWRNETTKAMGHVLHISLQKDSAHVLEPHKYLYVMVEPTLQKETVIYAMEFLLYYI